MDRRCSVSLVVVGALIFVSARGEEKPHGQFSPPSPTTITFSQGGASTNNNSSSVIVEAYWSQPTLEDLKPPTRVVIQPTALSPHKAKRYLPRWNSSQNYYFKRSYPPQKIAFCYCGAGERRAPYPPPDRHTPKPRARGTG
jgi:hypothetical protein